MILNLLRKSQPEKMNGVVIDEVKNPNKGRGSGNERPIGGGDRSLILGLKIESGQTYIVI
tara:strand:- start:299 stop:478 length:180 start_codon:yes stop_codon:yes gene_type:complete